MEDERPGFDDLLHRVKQLPNAQLTQHLRRLNEQKCVRDAELLLYLSELDQRGLYRQEAVSSLFEFCVSRLGCSEDTAWKRVGAARLMRRFPLVFDLLSAGQIHLSALMLVKPHLTEENHQEWLLAACGKSKRQEEMLVARRCPKPDVATSVRKLPQPRTAIADEGTSTMPPRNATPEAATSCDTSSEDATRREAVPNDATATHCALAHNVVAGARISPLSGSSYRVTFTASERLKQKLERARELASHVISPSDLPGLLERALDLLIEREEQRRCAFGKRPRANAKCHRDDENQAGTENHAGTKNRADSALQVVADNRTDANHHTDSKGQAAIKQQPCQLQRIGDATAQDPGQVAESDAGDRTLRGRTHGPLQSTQPAKPRSRHVPAAVRREIWQRDGGRCTFIDAQGNRCEERCFLEIEHLRPFALNGATSVSNCTLRCHCHNTLAAEWVFGRRKIDAAILRARNDIPPKAGSLGIANAEQERAGPRPRIV